jgi:hypothetical protein
MTKKHKHPRRSSALEGDEAEPLSAPLVDPTLKPKPRKRRGPYDPYPGFAPQMDEAEFYKLIAGGPVSFTRPAPPAAPATSPAEPEPIQAQRRPASKPRTGR